MANTLLILLPTMRRLHLLLIAVLSAVCVSRIHGSTLVIGAVDNAAFLQDVQAKLIGTSLLSGSIDTFNARLSTPSLALLESYSSVLLFSDSTFKEANVLGNNLADYVDAGGGVVQASFSFYPSSFNLEGRWRTGGYEVWAPPGGHSDLTLRTLGDIHVLGSPILSGVTTFSGGALSLSNAVTLLSSGAVAIAEWSDGTPLIAENMSSFNGGVVGLNFFPVSSDVPVPIDWGITYWDSRTDGAKIMANALNHVAAPVPDEGATLVLLSGAFGLFGLARTLRRRA